MISIAVRQELKFALKSAQLAEQLQIPLIDFNQNHYDFLLVYSTQGLELHDCRKKMIKPLCIDFLAGKLSHRRLYGGGKYQLLARAIGLHRRSQLSVLDVTAGFGEDAFILACLGANVVLLERSPIVAALLNDAIDRGNQQEWFRELSFNFIQADAIHYLQQISEQRKPDVIYLDPMFPIRKKSALVKKEMRILRDLVGEDLDAVNLLTLSRRYAIQRVVVKRPRFAEQLDTTSVDICLKGESVRYDIYLCGK